MPLALLELFRFRGAILCHQSLHRRSKGSCLLLLSQQDSSSERNLRFKASILQPDSQEREKPFQKAAKLIGQFVRDLVAYFLRGRLSPK